MRIESSVPMRILGMIAILWMTATTAFAQQTPEEEARRYYLRGIAAVEMAKSNEDLAAAIVEFRKATQVAPGMASAWHNLGMVQARVGQLKEAIESFTRYVAVAPKTEDTQKIRDEIIKLEYRLEQSGKYNHLAGTWLEPNGNTVSATTEGGRLTFLISRMNFPGSVERWMWGDLTGSDQMFENIKLHLEVRGNRVAGVMEIDIPASTSSGSRHQWCNLPAGKETSQVEGVLEDGQLILKISKMKYKLEHNKGENMLFGSTWVRCDAVTPMGNVAVETKFRGPMPALGRGGIGVELRYGTDVIQVLNHNAGLNLEPGDEIVSVNGVVLKDLPSEYERMLTIRGEPGSAVDLVVSRVVKKAGAFSAEKRERIQVSGQRVELVPN